MLSLLLLPLHCRCYLLLLTAVAFLLLFCTVTSVFNFAILQQRSPLLDNTSAPHVGYEFNGLSTANDNILYYHTDQNIAGRYFNELVDILVHKGNLNREYTESSMAQRVVVLRQDFSNLAKHFAFDYFSTSVSSQGESAAQLAVVMQALQDWEVMTSQSSP